MIFSTFNQINVFLIFLFNGIVFSIIFNLFSVFFLKFHQKTIQKCIFECIFYSFFGILFIFSINYFNFGEYSLILILAQIMAHVWTSKTINKSIVKLENKWYNHVMKLLHELKLERNSRKELKKKKYENKPGKS